MAGAATESKQELNIGTEFSPPEFVVDLDQSPRKRWDHVITPFVSHIKTCLDHIWEICGASNNDLYLFALRFVIAIASLGVNKLTEYANCCAQRIPTMRILTETSLSMI